jgi:restriction modification system DNA specificity domain protein
MKYKLSEIGRIVTGKTPSTKNKTSFSEEPDKYLFVTPRDMNGSEKTIKKTERYLTDEVTNTTFKNLVINDKSICVSCIGTIGKVFMPSGPAITNQQINSITEIKNFVLPDYLYYYLVIHQKDIENLAGGTTMPIVNKTSFEQLEVEIPDLETQKKIVRILSALDRKIELNNQLDLTVHNNLNAIFEDWFVHKNYNSNQSKWRKEKLGNFVTINRGLSYKGQFLSDSGTPMINLGNIMPGGIFRSEKNKYYTGEFKNKVVVKAGDLVMANTDMTQKREVLGTPLIVPSIYDGDVIFSHHIYSIKSEKIPTLFLYYLLLRKDFSDTAGGGATGTTVLFLPKDIIENYEFVLPDDAEINRFVDIAKKVLQRRNNIMHENMALKTIRDTLLSRLMSGEIILEKVKI